MNCAHFAKKTERHSHTSSCLVAMQVNYGMKQNNIFRDMGQDRLVGIKKSLVTKAPKALVTHIVTVAKYSIYDVRRRNIRPCFSLKKILMREFDSERYIARRKQKDEDFKEKWKVLWREMTHHRNSRIGAEQFQKKAYQKTDAFLIHLYAVAFDQ